MEPNESGCVKTPWASLRDRSRTLGVSAQPDEQSRLDILDGLRGLAILLVLWFHIWELSWLEPILRLGPFVLDCSAIVRTGFLGVDLFFFLSGFCLFYPYARAHFDGAARPTLAHFASRRAMKILPSYVVSIAGAFALGYAQLTFKGGPAELLRMHALFFLPSFSTDVATINGVLWSLGVEAQFYVLFPLVARLMERRPSLAMIGALIVASAYRAYVEHLNPTQPHLYMEQLPAVIDLFASGMFAAYLFRLLDPAREGKTPTRPAWTLLALCGLATYVAVASCMYATAASATNWPYPSYPSAFPFLDLAFVALTLGSLFGLTAWRRALACPPLVFLALISYNLYLWHQMIAFELLHHGIPAATAADPHADASWSRLFTCVAVAASAGAACVLTWGMERPLLRLRLRRKPGDSPSLS